MQLRGAKVSLYGLQSAQRQANPAQRQAIFAQENLVRPADRPGPLRGAGLRQGLDNLSLNRKGFDISWWSFLGQT